MADMRILGYTAHATTKLETERPNKILSKMLVTSCFLAATCKQFNAIKFYQPEIRFRHDSGMFVLQKSNLGEITDTN